jgi:hypothetical protein
VHAAQKEALRMQLRHTHSPAVVTRTSALPARPARSVSASCPLYGWSCPPGTAPLVVESPSASTLKVHCCCSAAVARLLISSSRRLQPAAA